MKKKKARHFIFRCTCIIPVVLLSMVLLPSCGSTANLAHDNMEELGWYEIPGQIVRIQKREVARSRKGFDYFADLPEPRGSYYEDDPLGLYRVVEPFAVNTVEFSTADVYKAFAWATAPERGDKCYRFPAWFEKLFRKNYSGDVYQSTSTDNLEDSCALVLCNMLSEANGLVPVYWVDQDGTYVPYRRSDVIDSFENLKRYIWIRSDTDGFRLLTIAERTAALNTPGFREQLGMTTSGYNESLSFHTLFLARNVSQESFEENEK